ncbi:hypothetical protein LTR86_011023 [Recurvomyces mirabilis]|nr:hypothetical protein LTR86_011023 [Recurvomyces mirabilis]
MESGRVAADIALRELFTSGKYSDLTIICAERRFAVHKSIVCTRSPFFAKACEEGRWKVELQSYLLMLIVDHQQEGVQNIINLEAEAGDDLMTGNDDPKAVHCMFEFLYCHTYATAADALPNDDFTKVDDTCLHAKVYALGDKYGIPSLKEESLAKFRDVSKHSWREEGFIEAVRICFATTGDGDKGLRNIVVRILNDHVEELADKPEVEDVIRSIDGLAYDLWKKSKNLTPGPRCKICETVVIRECDECSRGKIKRGSSTYYFAACNCDDLVRLCQMHRAE